MKHYDHLPSPDSEALKHVKRKWAAELAKKRVEASAAIAASNSSLQNTQAAAQAIELLCEYSATLSSHERLPKLLPLLARCGSALFWPVLLREWASCDATWTMQHKLKGRMLAARNRKNVREYYDDGAGNFFDALPNQVRVFRGCSRERIKGLSWTTDIAVACGFARGHRNVPVPSPVVATALIPKRRIFFVALGRNESEVVLDPNFLVDLSLRGTPQRDEGPPPVDSL